ncbi:hypothetical protein VNO78_30469 [Psophocarpus tetragonolobus]|uniref:Uncharacterized protein n=1 Tax=Psophocarpus tetragonolobus TaxID=3891 RepID=A0AAN9RXE5_PSOTE
MRNNSEIDYTELNRGNDECGSSQTDLCMGMVTNLGGIIKRRKKIHLSKNAYCGIAQSSYLATLEIQWRRERRA